MNASLVAADRETYRRILLAVCVLCLGTVALGANLSGREAQRVAGLSDSRSVLVRAPAIAKPGLTVVAASLAAGPM